MSINKPSSLQQLNTGLDPTLWPIFENLQVGPESTRLVFTVNHQLGYFKGHFPEQAVLPGVVQVHWTGELARRLFNSSGFTGLRKVKFKQPILPGTRVTLSLDFESGSGTLNFRFHHAEKVFSSGVMMFGAGQ
ncbi:MAG: thioester dehydrase [Gammaproteobacteria bacterium]|nr:thioester dehydrase [Gammaproteobacteria bacterium]